MGADHSPYVTSFNSDLTEARKDTYSVHMDPIYTLLDKYDPGAMPNVCSNGEIYQCN